MNFYFCLGVSISLLSFFAFAKSHPLQKSEEEQTSIANNLQITHDLTNEESSDMTAEKMSTDQTDSDLLGPNIMKTLKKNSMMIDNVHDSNVRMKRYAQPEPQQPPPQANRRKTKKTSQTKKNSKRAEFGGVEWRHLPGRRPKYPY